MANSAVVGTLRAILSADTAEFAMAMKKAGDAADQTAKDMTKASASFEAAGGRMAAVTRLVKDFSGALEKRSAEEFAMAIEKIGGAARLSENELRRAGAVFADYISKAKALGQEVPAHLQKVSREISNLSSVSTGNVGVIGQIRGAFQNLGPSVLAAAGGFATALISVEALTRGLRASIDFVKESIQAYAEAEKANRKLTAALEAQGQATPKTVRAYQDLANQFQKTTVFQDDLITEMQTLLVQVGNVMPAEMEKALEAVTNLASGLGIDLRSATLMVAKASEENFTALKKIIPAFDETRAKAEGFDYILGQINSKFGGQAAADLATFDGQLKATGNQFDELKEQIGKVIVQSTAFQIAFAAIRAELAQLGHELKVIESGFKVLGTVPGPVGTAFSVFFGNLKETDKSAKAVQSTLIEWQGPMQSSEQKLAKLTTTAKVNTKAVDELSKAYQNWADEATGAKLLRDLATLETRLQRLTREGGLNERAMRAIAVEADKLGRELGFLPPTLQTLVNQFIGFNKGVVTATVSLPQFSDRLSVSGDEIKLLAADFQLINKHFTDFNKIVGDFKLPDAGLGPEDLQAARDSLESFGSTAANTFAAIGSGIQQLSMTMGDESAEMAQSIAGIAIGLGRLAAGDYIGGAIQVAGSLASIKTLWRNVARDMEDTFATTELGFEHLGALNQRLRDLGRLDLVSQGERAQRKDDEEATRQWMQDVFDFFKKIDTAFATLQTTAEAFGGAAPDALQPYINALLQAKGLTEDQRKILEGMAGDPSWQQLQQIADKYGISLGSLGQKFQDARLGQMALDYARDFNTLKEAGGDVNGLLIGMQDEVQNLVNDALRFGTKMPEAMRPVLQGLIDMGLLTDENGNKLEDLSRFEFSGAFEDIFKDMKTILEEIRDLLAVKLPKAADEGAKGIEDAFKGRDYKVPVRFEWGDLRPPEGFGRSETDAPSAQHGGVVSKTGLVNVHAGEIIQPLDEASGSDRYAIYLDNYLDGRKITETVLVHTREVARRIGVRPI